MDHEVQSGFVNAVVEMPSIVQRVAHDVSQFLLCDIFGYDKLAGVLRSPLVGTNDFHVLFLSKIHYNTDGVHRKRSFSIFPTFVELLGVRTNRLGLGGTFEGFIGEDF